MDEFAAGDPAGNRGDLMDHTIVFDDGHRLVKIAKILLLKEGGFALLAPYHAAQRGYLIKHLEFRTPTTQGFCAGGDAANTCWPARCRPFPLWRSKRSYRGLVIDDPRMTPQTGLSGWHIRATV